MSNKESLFFKYNTYSLVSNKYLQEEFFYDKLYEKIAIDTREHERHSYKERLARAVIQGLIRGEKILGVVLMLWTLIVAGVSSAEAAALPHLGEAKAAVEAQYGAAYVVQEDTLHFRNGEEWRESLKTKPSQAKAYGYAILAQDKKGTLWVEYNADERVKKETLLLEENLKIRHLGKYFQELQAALTAKDSLAVILESYPRTQLAVRIGKTAEAERWVRFFVVGEGKTHINMHSEIKGFEITESSCLPGEVKAPTEGAWTKSDNYFLPRLYFSEPLLKRKKTELIVVHHAAMPLTTTREDIQDLHLTNGWAGIGYHKLVFADGKTAEGRPENVVGAHALGVNQRSLGIVLVGDFSKERPPMAQLQGAANLTRELMEKYHVALENVKPHRAVTEGTDCPGAAFPWQEFISLIAAAGK